MWAGFKESQGIVQYLWCLTTPGQRKTIVERRKTCRGDIFVSAPSQPDITLQGWSLGWSLGITL